ncbi:MAG: hypothetical protein J7L11_01260 [Thermoprotei archaeon]|nr:hypothetical protein [Thermoprotei archaeon]
MSEKTRRRRFLAPNAKVYYKGEWVKVSELPIKSESKYDIARRELTRRVIEEVLKSLDSGISRGRLVKLAREVSSEIGLRRKVNPYFLIREGVLGRVRGARHYFLTEKARELFPELFKE